MKSNHSYWIHKETTLEHPVYSSALSPIDHQLFPALKRSLGSLRFKDNHDVGTVVTRRLITKDKNSYLRGMQKLIAAI
jgi:hypothetical protein